MLWTLGERGGMVGRTSRGLQLRDPEVASGRRAATAGVSRSGEILAEVFAKVGQSDGVSFGQARSSSGGLLTLHHTNWKTVSFGRHFTADGHSLAWTWASQLGVLFEARH